jgi:hypothetical protein
MRVRSWSSRRRRSSTTTSSPRRSSGAKESRKRELEPGCLKARRERMASEAGQAGQAVYALRKRIERIHADRKNHGFGFLPVRGLIKAKAHALWHALANNLLAAHRLRLRAAA